MTQEIIEMAKQAGLLPCQGIHMGDLKAFAELVAAKEREACAKLCEAYQDPFCGNALAEAIRARGEA